MSEVRNQNINKKAQVDWKTLPVATDNVINMAGVTIFSLTPGYPFRIEKISTFCRSVTATATATVLVGGRLAASLTFTTATELAATLSTTIANLKGSATEAITVVLTTNGTGALVNGFVNITFRPWPKAGEIGPVAA